MATSIRSEDIEQEICDRLSDGESLVAICSDEHMPNRRTVLRWMESDQDFASRCARTREAQGDYMDHLILQEAINCTPEMAQVSKVRISAYQWRAAKLSPKKYGDKQIVEQTSEVTVKPSADYSKLSRDERETLRQLLLKSTPDK